MHSTSTVDPTGVTSGIGRALSGSWQSVSVNFHGPIVVSLYTVLSEFQGAIICYMQVYGDEGFVEADF